MRNKEEYLSMDRMIYHFMNCPRFSFISLYYIYDYILSLLFFNNKYFFKPHYREGKKRKNLLAKTYLFVYVNTMIAIEEKTLNIEEIEIEDGEPVDNILSEKQMRLLTETLYSSWTAQGHSSFFVSANVGIFTKLLDTSIVPDVLLSLDVDKPKERKKKEDLCYYLDKIGKPPEVVIEIVSNKVGGELENKLIDYGKIGVKYYVVYDPGMLILEDSVLHCYEYKGRIVERREETWFREVSLGIRLWVGFYEGEYNSWLRWCDSYGEVIPTGKEASVLERKRAEKAEKQLEISIKKAISRGKLTIEEISEDFGVSIEFVDKVMNSGANC
ncbi:MAG: Uma2 family endonuclease [Leptospiraceae bacterium]|nr:Uma2 family endonuclease [Leptospiraceae bacterium]MCP5494439.1 Uma2 family endonuclease [Leptospiraceae bacterium]